MGSKSREDMGARPRVEQGGNDQGRKSGQLDLSNGSANGQVCDLEQKFSECHSLWLSNKGVDADIQILKILERFRRPVIL